MFTARGTVNQLPVKSKYRTAFMALLVNQNIPYKVVGSMQGYFIYEFNSEFDKGSALYYRDTLYKTNKL